jgi:molybdopterin converting factor small subunit
MATIELPAALRAHAGQQRQIPITAATVAQAFASLQRMYPALDGFLIDGGDHVPPHVVVFVDGRDIRDSQGAKTALFEHSVVTVVLPVAGGATLSHDEIRRYGRQLLLPWMSGRAQCRWRSITAGLNIIAGDTASHWAAVYVVAAGIGRLQLSTATKANIIVEDIDGSPLLRTTDIGQPLANGLAQRLQARTTCAIAVAETLPMITDIVALVIEPADHRSAMMRGSHAAAVWLRSAAAV